MRKVKNRKNLKKGSFNLAIILLLLSISLGYAYLSKTLTINGLAKIEPNTWKIQWSRKGEEKLTLARNSAGSIVEEATISSSEEGKNYNDVVEFSVVLDKPGDMYELEVYRENAGTIDAVLDSYTVEGLDGTENFLTFSILDTNTGTTITDENGYGNLLENVNLNAGDENKLKLKLKFEEDIAETDLLEEALNLTIRVQLNYVQAVE